MKIKAKTNLLFCLFTLMPLVAFAQEQITLTTYYPSPYGVYKSLRLYPTDDFTPGGNCGTEGEIYYDASEHTIYVCSGSPAAWTISPGQQAASSYWSIAPSNPNNIYNINSGNVGIGTNNPLEKLHLIGNLNVTQTLSIGGGSGFNGASDNVPVSVRGTATALAMRIESAFSNGLGRLDMGLGRLVSGAAYCQFSTINDQGTGGAHIVFMPDQTGISGNVGIAINTPSEKLDVYGNAFIGNQSSIGGYLTRIRSTENYFAGGADQMASVLEQVSIYSSSAGPGIALGFTGNTGVHTSVLVVRGSGNVGIGTREPTYQLELTCPDSEHCAAKLTGGPWWTIVSDRRLKKDIHPFTDGLEVLRQINPVRYKLNGKAALPEDAEGISVIGQEIEDVAPYTVKRFKAKLEPTDTEETELLSFDSSPLLFVVANAIREQEAKLEKLEAELNKLEN